MRLFARIILLLISLLPGSSCFAEPSNGVEHPEFPRAAYEGARDFARDLIERYSPQEHYFLSVGRSPAPIAEILRSLNLKGLGEMPFSGGKYVTRTAIESRPELRRRLTELFKKFLPDKKRLAGRELVVLDYAINGQGVEGALEAIRWYYGKTCPDCKLRVVALTNEAHTETNLARVAAATGIPIDPISARNYPGLRQSLKDQLHDKLTRFGQYEVAFRDLPDDLINPGYKLGEIIQDYVASDPQRIQYKVPRKKKPPSLVSPIVECYQEALK